MSKEERRRPREWHAAWAFSQLVAGKGDVTGAGVDFVIVCDLNVYRRGRARPGEPCHIVDDVNRLDRATDRCWRAASKEERRRPREWHAAWAFSQLVAGKGDVTGAGVDFVIVCDLNAYRRGRRGRGSRVTSSTVGRSRLRWRELAEDAFLKVVLHDGVNIHTAAHFGRHRPAALQTALDMGAAPAFEGVACTDCDRKYHLQWDRVDPCANGGITSLDNLQPRCPPCHHAKTERDRKRGLLRSGKKERGALGRARRRPLTSLARNRTSRKAWWSPAS